MQEIYLNPEHAPSLLPDGTKWTLVWNDEFDGTELDRTKWDYRLSMMGKRHPTWVDDGVSLDGNSNAVFRIYEKDGEICSSQLQTGYNYMDTIVEKSKFGADDLQWPIGPLHQNKFTHGFGYYECRCKLQETEGWWSAFWLQSPIIGCCLDPKIAGIEVDVMECFHHGAIAPHNLFFGGYGKDMQNRHVGGVKGLDTSVYHVFGVNWNAQGYTFYIDGQEDGRIEAPVSHQEQFILISTEVQGYRREDHRPSSEAYQTLKAGDRFLVDYVRVYDAVNEK